MISPGPAVRGERTLERMRRYTTGSLVFVMVTFTVVTVAQAPDWPWRLALFACGALSTWLTIYWESRPPWWLAAPTLVVLFTTWTWSIAARQPPFPVIVVAMAVLLLVHRVRRRRVLVMLAAFAAILAPVAVIAALRPEEHWTPWLLVASVAYLASLGLFLLNDYGWGLNLELDEARRDSAELAVAKERFRFAADLHDIQGHTLHVIRLKTRLAARLIATDPEAARAQLDEADALIGETLQNTRGLAFGERTVTLAGELANARGIAEAAGIAWSQSGEPSSGAHEELLGLTVREATTNLLRHAQARRIEIILGAREVTVRNDGVSEPVRHLGGLAILGERLRSVGGGLDAGAADGTFTTRAWVP